MSRILNIIVLMLVITLAACVSTQPNMSADNNEDRDIGIGGTGMLATKSSEMGSGLGGTGIVGQITGFGSIFVNGVEIEYDNSTDFYIDGQAADYQQLVIGDVVEVLTTNDHQHTDAKIINIRHELIGKVESISPQTYSFTVQGQTVVVALNNANMPEVGKTVAISGFRVNETIVQATRVMVSNTDQVLLRKHTDLPFSKQVNRWIVQDYIKNNQTSVRLAGVEHVLSVNKQSKDLTEVKAGVKIMRILKTGSAQLEVNQLIDPIDLPRGELKLRLDSNPGSLNKPGAKMMQGEGQFNINNQQNKYRGRR